MPFTFENLQVYQRAVDFADSVAALSEKFPRGFYFLVDQLIRAALSIATNLAEGNGRSLIESIFSRSHAVRLRNVSRSLKLQCAEVLSRQMHIRI